MDDVNTVFAFKLFEELWDIFYLFNFSRDQCIASIVGNQV